MSLFDLKQKLDNKLFAIFNAVSDIALLSNPKNRKILALNKTYENKHSGQRAFILGTGPSLGYLPASEIVALQNEITFGVNSFYKAEITKTIVPTYYTLMDNNYWGISKDTFKHLAERYKDRCPTIITDIRASSCVPNELQRILIYAKNYPISAMRYDLSKNLSITMNVVSFSILAAIYMGCKEIYLLGCDYNSFCSQSSTHCYDDASEIHELPTYNLAFYLKYYHLTTEFHYGIAKLAKRKGVNVFNITKGSLLDAYPRRDSSAVLL